MRTLFLAILICCFGSLQALDVRGAILYEDDTALVIFDLPTYGLSGNINFRKVQYVLKYKFPDQKKTTKLFPSYAKEIRFHYRGEKIRMITVPEGTISDAWYSPKAPIFLKINVDGSCRLFEFFYEDVGPNSRTTRSIYYLRKGRGGFFEVRKGAFKRTLSAYFNDCAYIIEKIKFRQLRFRDLEEIVRFYNDECL